MLVSYVEVDKQSASLQEMRARVPTRLHGTPLVSTKTLAGFQADRGPGLG